MLTQFPTVSKKLRKNVLRAFFRLEVMSYVAATRRITAQEPPYMHLLRGDAFGAAAAPLAPPALLVAAEMAGR